MIKTENIKTFELAGIKWTVLEEREGQVICIADIIKNMEFGKNNDWKKSDIRKFLNGEFLQKLENAIGAENIFEFERDLLSLDGQTGYGKCKDKVSLITFDEYRKYRKSLPNTGKWWWTVTPHSTACNNDSTWIAVVSPSGNFSNYVYYCINGVRPFCIFSSSIFESKVRDAGQ